MSDVYFPNVESLEPIDKPIDRFDLDEDAKKDTCLIWNEIVTEYKKRRTELEEYIRKRDKIDEKITIEHLPVIVFLNEYLLPLVSEGLIELLEKVRDENSFFRQKSAFNGLDYLSEYLYNMNPRYPQRKQEWTYIFDMEWVNHHLAERPRPYYPFSLLWSDEYAAIKIQSYMRGYWIRRREDVQEVRTFWRDYKASKEENRNSLATVD